jgi:hypothetical protein
MVKIKTILSNIDSILNLDMRDVARMQYTKRDIDNYIQPLTRPQPAQQPAQQPVMRPPAQPQPGIQQPAQQPTQQPVMRPPRVYTDYSRKPIAFLKTILRRNNARVNNILTDDEYDITDDQRARLTTAHTELTTLADAPTTTKDEMFNGLERVRRILSRLGSMEGEGLAPRMKGRGLTRPDYTQGIEPSARYIKFGRYMINNKKLNDNVLSLRRSKGSTIASIPATKMTSQLGNVFKKIVGGGVPSYDELNSLTDAEKKYLYKVSQEADIYDKIKIPTPCKDEEEKDIHLFNVMKGEIMAGNNSKELVGKFKVLLNKLSRTNILPKSQVREILEELLELGF